jgi:K+-transporting ATPase ATPase C chain
MKEKQSLTAPIIRLSLLTMVLCGLIYPFAVTGIAQAVMPDKADGSLIYNEKGKVIGSEFIGQTFTSPEYFHGRVSSIEYNAAGSGSNNYASSNEDMLKRTKESLKQWQKENPTVPVMEIPIDLVTNSGSGLDPHISPEAAYVQIDRIAKATGLSKEELKELVEKYTEGRELGIFGEKKVNVLLLNLDLQNMMK